MVHSDKARHWMMTGAAALLAVALILISTHCGNVQATPLRENPITSNTLPPTDNPLR